VRDVLDGNDEKQNGPPKHENNSYNKPKAFQCRIHLILWRQHYAARRPRTNRSAGKPAGHLACRMNATHARCDIHQNRVAAGRQACFLLQETLPAVPRMRSGGRIRCL